MVIVDVEWVMLAFIMGGVLDQWVGWANFYCDAGT